MNEWMAYLKPAEKEALREYDQWVNVKPGFISKMMNLANKPVNKLLDAMPEKARKALGATIGAALSSAKKAASLTISEQKIVDKLSAELGFDVGARFERMPSADIAVLDKLAKRIVKNHCRACGAEGTVTGAAGAAGFVADIPSLYAILYRMVLQVACCYGFPPGNPEEDAFMLKVIDVGHFIEDSGRRAGMERLNPLSDLAKSDMAIHDARRYASAKTVEALAHRLAASLIRRKAAQGISVVGAVIAAGVNYSLAKDVGTVAFQAYRRRFAESAAKSRMNHATRVLSPMDLPPGIG